jgi:hypothetical protein
VVESSALLKRRTPKGYRGFESLPHRHFNFRLQIFDFRLVALCQAVGLAKADPTAGARQAQATSEALIAEPRRGELVWRPRNRRAAVFVSSIASR